MTEKPRDTNRRREALALGLGLITVPMTLGLSPASDESANASERQLDPVDSAHPGNATASDNGNSSSFVLASNAKAAAIMIPAKLSQPNAGIYTVKSGDSLSKIATKLKTSVSSLVRLNNLDKNGVLNIGQVLKLTSNPNLTPGQRQAESTRTHIVLAGETLTQIGHKFGVSVEIILTKNGLRAGSIIYPGQKLTIGKIVAQAVPNGRNLSATTHVVSRGESVSQIAAHYGLSTNTLIKINRLSSSSIIYEGQTLKLTSDGVSEHSGTAVASVDSSNYPCLVHGFHKVKTGETVSKIAAVFGTSTQSVLTANQLSWKSPIFVGQKLVIPSVHSAEQCPGFVKLSVDMQNNALQILRVAKKLRVSDFGIVIALAAAAQESGLLNLNHGHLDSVGIFQQRPSAHWGSAKQLQDLEYSARAFFGGETGPNFGKVRGLLDIPNWKNLSLTQAAQAVQVSAYPSAYAKWENSAWVWLQQLRRVGSPNA